MNQLTKCVQTLDQSAFAASEHRRVAQREATCFGFTQLLEQIEKVSGLVRLECYNEFLIVQAKRICCVQLYRSIFRTDAQALFHHFLPLLLRARIPFARALQRANEQVISLARNYVCSILGVLSATTFDKHRSLGHRQQRVRRLDVLSHLSWAP